MLFAPLFFLLGALAAPATCQVYTDSGEATYYNVGDAAQNDGYAAGSVACSDRKYSDDEHFVALSGADFDNGNNCGKWVWLYDVATEKTAYAEIVDSCTSCAAGHIDLSVALWKELHGDNYDEGIIDVHWGIY